MSEVKRPEPVSPPALHGNLLNATIRREITDLNRLFLDCALDARLEADPWFRVPESARQRLLVAPLDVLDRAACSPVALFELDLPVSDDAHRVGVAEASDAEEASRGQVERRRSFGIAVLQVVRRMADDLPLSTRIAFGLGPVAEGRARGLTLAESYRLACWSGLIRPRWPGYEHYWSALVDAAIEPATDVLHWAYSAGLCLLGQCARQPATITYGPRRPPRPTHRRNRSPGGGAGVPC
jgi:hypothetical protein